MSIENAIAAAENPQIRAVVTRLVTLQMAREVAYRACIQSLDDMNDILQLSIGAVPIDVIIANERLEADALRSVCRDMLHNKELAGTLDRLLRRRGDTLVEPPTESILHAAVILVLWPYLEVGYADLDVRDGLWVAIKGSGIPQGLLHGLLFTTFG